MSVLPPCHVLVGCLARSAIFVLASMHRLLTQQSVALDSQNSNSIIERYSSYYHCLRVGLRSSSQSPRHPAIRGVVSHKSSHQSPEEHGLQTDSEHEDCPKKSFWEHISRRGNRACFIHSRSMILTNSKFSPLSSKFLPLMYSCDMLSIDCSYHILSHDYMYVLYIL